MKVQYRKALCYFGVVLAGLTIYGGMMALWSLLNPWDNLVWNNKAIQTNATIITSEIRSFIGRGATLYVGYIAVTYDGYWAQLRAVEDNLSRSQVEQLLRDLFPANSKVIIYYHSNQPSNPHLGPKSILGFLMWLLFSTILFVGLTGAVSLIIYRDYVLHKLTYTEEESIKLYTQEDIRLGRYS